MLSREYKNKFYVYVHTNSKGIPFYVGKGKNHRAFTKYGRSKDWFDIAEKEGLSIYVSCPDDDELSSYVKEKEVISFLLNSGIKLTNVALGGGPLTVVSEETKMKLRNAFLGKKQSPEHAAKSRINRLGHKNTPENIEKTASARRRAVINSDGEVFKSASHAARSINPDKSLKGQSNITMCCMGKRNNALGFSWAYLEDGKPGFKPTDYGEKSIICVEARIKFKSALDAVNWIKSKRGMAVRQSISYAARTPGKKAYGYTWKYE